MVHDEISFFGHPNILSKHPRTIEITKDDFLTKRGDCIVGIKSNKGCVDLDIKLQKLMKIDEMKMKIEILVEEMKYEINGYGNNRITLNHKHDLVLRKSNFVCTRTASILCNKSSLDVPRIMVKRLQNSNTKGIMIISCNDY
ncbi:MAG: DUF371 domain-containing protein [Nitrososphaeraceae archaeon]